MGVIKMSKLPRHKVKPTKLGAFPNWHNQKCFIVAGGSSLKGYDFSHLKGENVIAVNRAMEFCDADIMYSQDIRLWGWYEKGDLGQEALKKYKEFKGIKALLTKENFPLPDVVNIPVLNFDGFDITQGLPFANNSGLGAICLAVALGAKQIYLLGFDMDKPDNFHSGYPGKTKQVVIDHFVKDCERLAPLLKQRAKIINLNPNSKLKCFDFAEDVFLEGYAGAGDNIWQRPFIKEYAKRVKNFYLMTYFPFFYWDIPNIKFVKPPYPAFKSAIKSMNRGNYKWVDKPKIKELSKPMYWVGFRHNNPVVSQFEQAWGLKGQDFTMPPKPEWISDAKKIIKGFRTKKKICVIHFPTKREEWQCPAREPKPEYLQMIIDKYKDKYYFVSLADIPNEQFYTTPRNIDKAFHKGELSLEQILGLVKLSDLVITGNCYLLPFALAMGAKIFSIWGGCQKPELFLSGWDLSNTTVVHPEPFCNCLNPSHDCNKEIPKEKIISAFENQGQKKALKKILFYKIGPRYHKPIRDNKALQKYQVEIINKEIDIKKYVKDNQIDLIITTHYPPKDIKKLGIEYLFCEAFLDGDKVFDRIGYHYTPKNEIKKYVDKVSIEDIDIPKNSKIAQPIEVSKDEFFKKYNLSQDDKYIVILGQEIGDKSLIHSHNKNIKTYHDYIKQLATGNPDVKFIFKPHPVYFTIKKNLAGDMDFINEYPNIISVNESIHSLFSIFDKFTAFSSTTIFEGLLKDKKFATIGYHFCDNPKIVLRPRSLKGLYNKLAKFKIDSMTRTKYLNFILNYYRIDLGSSKLLDRIEKTMDDYYGST